MFLISARGEETREETERWLAENGVTYEKLVLYGDISAVRGMSNRERDEAQAQFKASAINRLGLDAFVEDREYIRERLKLSCPDCVILSPQQFNPEDLDGRKKENIN